MGHPGTHPPPRRTALITGASGGLGAAFAEVFAAAGFDLVLSARREDRLRGVAARLEAHHGVQVHVVVCDLAAPGAGGRLCAAVAARGLVIDALVNNAGYAVPGAYVDSSWACHEAFLRVLVVAVTELTHGLLPGMVERGYGRILNVASLAGLLPAPAGHTLYAAAKAFVIRFSESLGREVGRRGVHVTALAPGFTDTEFHDLAGLRERTRVLPGFAWMTAAAVARQGYDAVMAGRPLAIPGRANRAAEILARALPRPLLGYLVRRATRGHGEV